MDPQLSRHFRQARLNQGIGLGKLAGLCGYKNLSRGSRRIDDFEHGNRIQKDLLRKMADVLGIDRATVDALIEEDRRQFFRQWNEWANEPIQPYLVVRMMAAIYSPVDLPDEIQSVEEAEAYAAAFARNKKLRCCLVLSRRISVWFAEDGSISSVTEAVPGHPNLPFMRIGGRDCVTKAVDHGLAIQQVHWPKKQEIHETKQEVTTDFGGGVRLRSSFEIVEDGPRQVSVNIEGPTTEFGECADAEPCCNLNFDVALRLVLDEHEVSLGQAEIQALLNGLDCDAITQHVSCYTDPFVYVPAMMSEIENHLLEQGVVKGPKKC